MHQACHDFVSDVLDGTTPKQVVEIGSRNINGGIRHLLPADAAYTGLDLEPGPGVDLIADAAHLDWPALRELSGRNKPDLVLCLEVLEHTPDWQHILTNAAGWLKHKGRLVVTAACDPRAPHSAVDGGPTQPGEHYRNIDPVELHDLLCQWGKVEIVVDRDAGDVRAVLTT